MTSSDKPRDAAPEPNKRDSERPLSDTLLGTAGSGGLAGQGGMIDIEEDDDQADGDGGDNAAG